MNARVTHMPVTNLADIQKVDVDNLTFLMGASVWSSDLNKAERIARSLNVGMVWINDVNVAFPEAPWGVRKGSGYGIELGRSALLEYAIESTSLLRQATNNAGFGGTPTKLMEQ